MNEMVFQLQPEIVVNNRNKLTGDFSTPEQRIVAARDVDDECPAPDDRDIRIGHHASSPGSPAASASARRGSAYCRIQLLAIPTRK